MIADIKCYELVGSLSGSVTNESEGGEVQAVKRRYLLGQCRSYNEAVNEIKRYAPAYVNTDGSGKYWVRRRLNLNAVGNKYFQCDAEYETLQPKPGSPGGGGDPDAPGEEEEEDPADADPVSGARAWDTTGVTERIYQALSETVYPGTQPSFDRAINVSSRGVEGLDVVRPGMRYSETWLFPAARAMSDEYIRAVYSLTGTVNVLKFRAFEAGEALFRGARCQWSADSPFVSITFDWECRKNDPAFKVNSDEYDDEIPAFAKEGWEFVWIRYQEDVRDDTLIRRPIAAYKNRVYPLETWAELLITELPAPGKALEVVEPAVPEVPAGPPDLPALDGDFEEGAFPAGGRGIADEV